MDRLPLRILSVITLFFFLFTFTVTPVLAARSYDYDAVGNMLSDGENVK